MWRNYRQRGSPTVSKNRNERKRTVNDDTSVNTDCHYHTISQNDSLSQPVEDHLSFHEKSWPRPHSDSRLPGFSISVQHCGSFRCLRPIRKASARFKCVLPRHVCQWRSVQGQRQPWKEEQQEVGPLLARAVRQELLETLAHNLASQEFCTKWPRRLC